MVINIKHVYSPEDVIQALEDLSVQCGVARGSAFQTGHASKADELFDLCQLIDKIINISNRRL